MLMLPSHEFELNNLCNKISFFSDDMQEKWGFIVSGLFGIGKTYFVEKAIQRISGDYLADAVLSFDAQSCSQSIFQLMSSINFIQTATESDNTAEFFQETKFNKQKFDELTAYIQHCDPELFKLFRKRSNLGFFPKSDSRSDLFCSSEEEQEILTKFDTLFAKKSERRILLQSEAVAVESLIVDLFNIAFPQGSEDILDENGKIKRKRIVFVIDNFEHVAASIFGFLFDYLVPYFKLKTFGDFISYEISSVNSEVKINEFFDFRFILASREKLDISTCNEQWQQFSEHIHSITLKPASKEELSEILEENRMNPETLIDSMLGITHGIPYLIELWLEAYRLGLEEYELSKLAQLASERIMRNKTEDQKTWIRCAAFLDDFDASGLECFPQIRGNGVNAYYYLSNSTELCEFQDSGRLRVIEPVKLSIKRSTRTESPAIENALNSISVTYKKISTVFSAFEPKEIEILRQIAFLPYFNIDATLPRFFSDEPELAIELVKRNPSLFINNKATSKLKKEYADVLMEYNKLLDRFDFDEKLEKAQALADSFFVDVRENLLKQEKDSELLREEINWQKKKISSKELSFQSLQNDYIDCENRLLNLRRQLAEQNRQKKYLPAAALFAATAVLLLFALNVDSLFGSMAADNTQIIKNILFALTTISAIALGAIVFNTFFSKKQRRNSDFIKDFIFKTEQEKQTTYDEMNILRSEIEDLEYKTKQAESKLTEYKLQIELYRSQLAEATE
jgi:hypothetical protein